MIGWTCPFCKLRTEVANFGRVFCSCGAITTPQGVPLRSPGVAIWFRWGDMTARVLSSIGLVGWKGCRCAQRRAWLNWAGARTLKAILAFFP